MEQWALCNSAVRPELAVVDRLLAKYDHAACPKGDHRSMKQAYVEFWEMIESLRVNLSTPGDWSAAYTSTSLNVLTIEERLSFADIRHSVIWIGSDATPTACASVGHFRKLDTVFEYHQCTEYLAQLAGLPRNDFQLIALAEFMRVICFLLKVAPLQRTISNVCGG